MSGLAPYCNGVCQLLEWQGNEIWIVFKVVFFGQKSFIVHLSEQNQD